MKTDPVRASIKSAKDENLTAGSLEGPFKLGATAVKAGSVKALPLRQGSARHKLMALVYSKAPKAVTLEDVKKALGQQANQALATLVRYHLLKQ
jgi:hypothetical protein